MSGLVLKLAPNERIYVNGALIENGGRRTVLRLPLRDTDLLRECDIVEDNPAADTLATACVLAQKTLIQRDGRDTNLARLMAQFRVLLRDPSHRENQNVLAAACRLSEGSLAGAHYLLLRAHRERKSSADWQIRHRGLSSQPTVQITSSECPT